MATFDEFYQSLPEDRNRRGEYFEKIFVPWFLRTDPEWSSKVRKIWLWDEYPQRWGKDCGIDLVYEDRQGNHWAIQSKCVSPDREISKAEIDSFLSESNDSRIYGRLLIASTDGIGKNALQVIERQEKQVVCFLREHFRQSEIEFPSTPNDLATGRRKDKRRPRPHQQEAIKNVVAGLQVADRGQLLMACGTGKTLTSLWIKEALNAKRTLVLLPSLSLLSQTLREWTAASQKEFNWICVCSDKSVAKQDKTVDDWIESVNELGVPVTSDPSEIRTFLLENEEGIVFSTYQSSPLVAEAQKSSDTLAFDIAFADEAHRCAGKVSAAFGCVLDGQKIRADKRLFMTATPRVLSNRIKSRAETEDIEVASMDDEDQFGRILHRLSFSEAIERDLLTDYRVVVIGVDDPSIQAKIMNRPLSSTGNGVETDYETLANHISISKSARDYNLQRIITFHGRVKGAQKFSQDHLEIVNWLPESSKSERSIKTGYVSGRMTSLERSAKINQLRNLEEDEIGILSNARCLSEGVDLPNLDGIAFIDPRSSQVDIIQAVGRAIRKSESKSFGYIILPVYIGDNTSIEEGILASRFNDIWEVILALKSQDDSLSEVLDSMRVEMGRHGDRVELERFRLKIVLDFPKYVSAKIEKHFRTELVLRTSDIWEERYGQLVEYVNKTGHARPPANLLGLGKWVRKQRYSYKLGLLSRNRVERLNQLMGWSWDPFGDDWEEMYYELTRFLQDHGHVRPHQGKSRLGTWVGTQRTLYKNGRLTIDRIQQLERLPGWLWNPLDDTWETNYKLLVTYLEEHQSVYPTQKEPVIGNWVTTQRGQYFKNQLDEEKTKRLEALPDWSWDPFNDIWEKKFSELQEYASKHSEASPLLSHPTLGVWVGVQRGNYQKGRLDKIRQGRLEALPGWVWDKNDTDWNKRYQELVLFVELHGHSQPLKDNSDLGKWVVRNRVKYKKGLLADEKIKLLERLGGWAWDKLDSLWEKRFLEVIAFSKEHGHARPAPSDGASSSLCSWVRTQRIFFKKGTLSSERITRLEQIPGWVWDPYQFDWDQNYLELKRFVEHHGHARPDGSISTIGKWVSTQRVYFANGKLEEYRINRLQDLPGWTWDLGDFRWKEMFSELQKYVVEYGHACPPQSAQSLGSWVDSQRQSYKKGKISTYHVELLESLPGWKWRLR